MNVSACFTSWSYAIGSCWGRKSTGGAPKQVPICSLGTTCTRCISSPCLQSTISAQCSESSHPLKLCLVHCSAYHSPRCAFLGLLRMLHCLAIGQTLLWTRARDLSGELPLVPACLWTLAALPKKVGKISSACRDRWARGSTLPIQLFHRPG